MILYTFYKNVLYVTAQFFFGFWSAFSGQPLYEPFIYQLYNITMTGLPIMYFALFDFEYEKKPGPHTAKLLDKKQFFFLKHPHLYRLGIEDKCFSLGHFIRWVIYGLVHAFIVYLLTFHFISIPGQSQGHIGKDLGFWVVGHVVYGTCVMVANILLIFKFNNYTGWGEFICIFSILSFFTIYFLQNFFTMFPQVYLIFDSTFVQPSIWAGIFLAIMQVVVFEMFLHRIEYLNVLGTNPDYSERYNEENAIEL